MLRPPSACRALVAVLVVVGVVATGMVSPVAQAQTPAAAPEEAAEAPPPSPLIGDFDGDGRSDQFWYGPAGSPDHLWYGQGSRGFSGRPVKVNGTYTPLVADFSGDGADDVLWYAPGAADDYLWVASGRQFVGRSIAVNGSYQPFVGDFDGDGRADVFWFSPSGADRVWYGTGGGGFTGREVSVTRPYAPVVGDFDANGTSDVVWYGSGAARDYFWRGTWSRAFVGSRIRVDGVYHPVVGDFGGDGHDDVYWHTEASNGDVLWEGRSGGAFEGSPVPSIGARVPFAGDFDGNGAADLVWDNEGTSNDRLWFGGAVGFVQRPLSVAGSYAPRPGDFDGDGRDDIFWFAAGDPRDALWFASGDRGFVARPNTLDPLPGPGLPLRRATFADQFNPYGYVAHAAGPTPPDPFGRQFGYSNTLEAFEHNYQRGFRVFELDWVRLADGTVLAAHDGTEARYGLPSGVTFAEATVGQLSGSYTVGGGSDEPQHFTPLFAEDIPDLLDGHPDAQLILDTKAAHVTIVRAFVDLTRGRPDLMDRLMPHVAGQSDLDQMRALYPIRNYVVALYRTQAFDQFDDAAVVDFVRRNRAPAVMMWFGTRDPSLSLRANMSQQRRYTATFDARLRAAGAVTYVHSLTNSAAVQDFASRRVGVYSNGPFPPFTVEPAPIEPNIEGAPLV